MNNLAYEFDKTKDLENGKTKETNIPEPVSFEEAIEIAGTGKFQIFILLTTGFCMSGVITESLAISFVLTSADCDLDMTLNEKGLVSSSAFLGLVLSAHLWGFLADTRGRRAVIKWSLFLSLFCSWASSLSHAAWMLSLMRFLTGFVVSGAGSTAYAYLGEFHGDKTRARAISWGASFISLGMLLLPAIAWAILPLDFRYQLPGSDFYYTPWRLYILVCSFPNLLALIMILIFPETPKFLLARGKVEQSLDVLARMYATNRRAKASDYPVKSLDRAGIAGNLGKSGGARQIMASIVEQTVPLFKPPLVKFTLMICLVQFGIFATSSGMFIWFPVIANDLMMYYEKYQENGDVCTVFSMRESFVNSTDDKCDIKVNENVFILTLILGFGFTATYLVVGMVINILGNKNLLVFGLVVCGISGIGVYFVTEYYLLVTLFGIFLASGVCVGLVNTITVDVFPTHLRAMAICLSLMMGRLGASAGSNAVGFMLENYCNSVFYVFGGNLLLCAFLTLLIPRKNPDKDKVVPHHADNSAES